MLICNSFLFSAKDGIHLPSQPYLPTCHLSLSRDSVSSSSMNDFHSQSLPLTVTLTTFKCKHTNEIVKNNWASCVETKRKKEKETKKSYFFLWVYTHSHAKNTLHLKKEKCVCTNVSQDYFCLFIFIFLFLSLSPSTWLVKNVHYDAGDLYHPTQTCKHFVLFHCHWMWTVIVTMIPLCVLFPLHSCGLLCTFNFACEMLYLIHLQATRWSSNIQTCI